jgi:hypothetical protein
VREVESEIVGTPRNEQGHYAQHDGKDGTNHYLSKTSVHGTRVSTTLGWAPSCKCDTANPAEDLGRAKKFTPRPCVVFDPFMGSGTVAYVARKLGRHAVGIDLNAEYLALAARRLQQQSLFAVET